MTQSDPHLVHAPASCLKHPAPIRRDSASIMFDRMAEDILGRGRSCHTPRRFTAQEIVMIACQLDAIGEAVGDVDLTLTLGQYGRGFYLLAQPRHGDTVEVTARREVCALLSELAEDHLMDGEYVRTIIADERDLANVLTFAEERLAEDPTHAKLATHLRREVAELLGVPHFAA